MKKIGMLTLLACVALAAAAGAQTTGTQDKSKKDPRAPEGQLPPAQLTDPESWKTQKEKDDAKKDKDGAKSKDKSDKASSSSAQSRGGRNTKSSNGWHDRAFISGNAGWQLSSTTFSDSKTLTDPGQVDPEKRSFTAKYETKSGPTFDIGGGVRLWGGLGAGVAVTRYSKDSDIAITGSVPHPFFFNQPRAIDGITPGKREETAVHVDAVYVVPVNKRVQVAIFGGPSFFSAKQTVVSNFAYSQSYPYDTAAFTSATSAEESKSVTGFNVGADVGYYFTDVIGVGGIIRFSRATFDSSIGKLDLGGPEVGFGVRVRIPQ